MRMSSYTTPPLAFVTHVWNLLPQGDSRGPYNLYFSCSTTASRIAIINQDLPPVFVFATGFDVILPAFDTSTAEDFRPSLIFPTHT